MGPLTFSHKLVVKSVDMFFKKWVKESFCLCGSPGSGMKHWADFFLCGFSLYKLSMRLIKSEELPAPRGVCRRSELFPSGIWVRLCPRVCGLGHMEKASVNESNSLSVWNCWTGGWLGPSQTRQQKGSEACDTLGGAAEANYWRCFLFDTLAETQIFFLFDIREQILCHDTAVSREKDAQKSTAIPCCLFFFMYCKNVCLFAHLTVKIPKISDCPDTKKQWYLIW